MPDRLAELRDRLAADYEDTRALLQRLGDDTLKRTAPNGWSVGELAGHIAVSPDGVAFVVNRLRAGKNATLPAPLAFLVDLTNWWEKRKFSKTSKSDLLAAAEGAYTKAVAYVNGLSGDELDRGGEVLGMGKLTIYEFINRNGDHQRDHAAELKQAIGL